MGQQETWATTALVCPTCSAELAPDGGDGVRCGEGHNWTAFALALTIDTATLQALWAAIRALEDEASSLNYMAAHQTEEYGMSADRQREEAAKALEAADALRTHAHLAQVRLNALPAGPSSPAGGG